MSTTFDAFGSEGSFSLPKIVINVMSGCGCNQANPDD
jgi:hypothetical protein